MAAISNTSRGLMKKTIWASVIGTV